MRLNFKLALRYFSVMAVCGSVLVSTGCEKNPYQNSRLRYLGKVALMKKEVPVAKGYFEKALEQDDADWSSHRYLGKIQLMQGEYLKARLSLEHALSIRDEEPETDAMRDELAEAIFKQGEFTDLYVMLEGICRDSHLSGDYVRQGKYMLLINDDDQAKTAFDKAIVFAKAKEKLPHVEMEAFYRRIGDTKGLKKLLSAAYGQNMGDKKIAAKIRALGGTPGISMSLPLE